LLFETGFSFFAILPNPDFDPIRFPQAKLLGYFRIGQIFFLMQTDGF
jgi:hypothetical protein